MGEGNGEPCATMVNLLGFITTDSLTANTHCMTDGLALVCLARGLWREACANRAINGLLINTCSGTSSVINGSSRD